MNNSHLIKGHCVPCEGGVEPMKEDEIGIYLSYLKTSWEITSDSKSIKRQFKFKDFIEAMRFVNKVAEIAEEQGHHPDISIYYNKVDILLTTHAIRGLSTNDFIMASKIEVV